jgi:hypothetical protein
MIYKLRVVDLSRTISFVEEDRWTCITGSRKLVIFGNIERSDTRRE